MSQTVLIAEPRDYSERALDHYRQIGVVETGPLQSGPYPNVTMLVIRLAHRVDGEFLDRFPALEALVSPTTGLNHIDLDEIGRRKIQVFSLQDCREAIEKVHSTSELTLGLIIALVRNICKANQDVVSDGSWDRDRFRGRELSRMTLGIVGLGRIGGHLCEYAKALRMRVLAFDDRQSEDRFSMLGAVRMPLEQLLAESDIVSMNMALNPETENLLDAGRLALMKTGAYLVNTARGELIDEAAAVERLRQGALSGIAADVLSMESDPRADLADSPLHAAAREGYNVILTPHVGGCTLDAMHITEECLAETVKRAYAVAM